MPLVHTLVVIDMQSGATLLDVAHEYTGGFALCGGSGGSESTTNTVDYAYNARMATLSEEQQEWAREYFDVWQQHQKPYEIAQANSNLEVLPLETDLYKDELAAASELLPQDKSLLQAQFGQSARLVPLEGALAQSQLNTAAALLPAETLLYESQIDAAKSLIPGQKEMYGKALANAQSLMPHESELYRKQLLAIGEAMPRESVVYSQFLDNASDLIGRESSLYKEQLENARSELAPEKAYYDKGIQAAERLLPQQVGQGERFLGAIRQGIDVNERMGLATADAAAAWKDAQEQALRANARLGVNPASGRFQGIMAALDTQRAAQMSGARSQARVLGEQENFQRMAHGAAYNGASMALSAALPLRPQAVAPNGAHQALSAGQAARPQAGSYNAALGNLQASASVKPDAGRLDPFASSAINQSRSIISQMPAGASSEILKGVNFLKG